MNLFLISCTAAQLFAGHDEASGIYANWQFPTMFGHIVLFEGPPTRGVRRIGKAPPSLNAWIRDPQYGTDYKRSFPSISVGDSRRVTFACEIQTNDDVLHISSQGWNHFKINEHKWKPDHVSFSMTVKWGP